MELILGLDELFCFWWADPWTVGSVLFLVELILGLEELFCGAGLAAGGTVLYLLGLILWVEKILKHILFW